MKNYLKEFEEALDNIVDPALQDDEQTQEAGAELTPQQRKLAALGQILMAQAPGIKDDALSNIMGAVGNELSSFGTPFAANSLEDLIKKTGATKEVIRKLLDYAENIQKSKSDLAKDHEDGGLDDTNDTDDDFNEPDDEELARQADAAARGMK